MTVSESNDEYAIYCAAHDIAMAYPRRVPLTERERVVDNQTRKLGADVNLEKFWILTRKIQDAIDYTPEVFKDHE